MSVPILLGANPKTAKPSVWIPIRFSKWAVRVEGLVDSQLVVALHSDWPIKEGICLPSNGEVYKGPCQVKVEFMKRGTERTISVFAFDVESK